jgi:serine/threonine protein kinase
VLDYYIVSELCAGGNLRDALYTIGEDGAIESKAPLEHDVVRQLLLEILSGLMHLHSNSIVHRNIKPTTIALVRPLDQLDRVSHPPSHLTVSNSVVFLWLLD